MKIKAPTKEDRPSAYEIWYWYIDAKNALLSYEKHIVGLITSARSVPNHMLGMSLNDIEDHFDQERDELEKASSLLLLAQAEAILRIDYKERGFKFRHLDANREFRKLYDDKAERAGLDDELLDIWTKLVHNCKEEVGHFRGALKFRHWLAHGRHWNPKLGRRYTPEIVFDIVEDLFKKLPVRERWMR